MSMVRLASPAPILQKVVEWHQPLGMGFESHSNSESRAAIEAWVLTPNVEKKPSLSPSFIKRSVALLCAASILTGCPRNVDVSQHVRKNLVAPDRAGKTLAVYEAWFGAPDHINAGYSSHDRVVLARQIEQAKGMGISGFIVDWYGTKKPFIDKSFELMEEQAAAHDFKVALMYDELVRDSNSTEETNAALDYAYERYVSSSAPAAKAYLRYNGHPVIFVWTNSDRTDWNAVREHVQHWPETPLLIDRQHTSPYLKAFDGVYAWINPGKQGWQSDGSNWGAEYLRSFYSQAPVKYPGKLILGASWPGFDDRRASWGQHRYMAYRCGKTFEDTSRAYWEFSRTTDSSPFLVLATWNDYEEATAIERGLADPSVERIWTDSRCG